MTLRKRLAVVGLGYVGLPLAEVFVRAGFDVVGYDTDAAKVEALHSGQCHLRHFSGLPAMLASGKFEPTSDPAYLAHVDTIVICVPTPLTAGGEPDLTCVVGAAQAIAPQLQFGQLVVLESSTYPGTTRDVVRPILESTTRTGPCGEGFFLAYSPEREDPGNVRHPMATIPKVVGGFDSHSLGVACDVYRAAFKEVVPVSSLEVAEACKLLENTYRLVNIALVNELKHAFASLGVDIWEVVRAAATKPFGFQPFFPGPGAGGHCIPCDPAYLTWAAMHAKRPTRCPLVERSLAANANEISHAVIAVGRHIARSPIGAKVCVLGLAYKRDIDDTRESPGVRILDCLTKAGIVVSYSDPHLPAVGMLKSERLTPEFVAAQDAVVIATDHSAFDYSLLAEHARLIIDTRNAMARRVCKGKVVKV